MQIMYAVIDGQDRQLALPHPDQYVLPNIRWGAFDELFTPAYWRAQAWMHEQLGTYSELRLGRTLVEELAACLLGGYGMPAELALAAFARLRDAGLLEGHPNATVLENALREPFLLRGVSRKYRFPRQKAIYLSACMEQLARIQISDCDSAFRDQLASLPGIGLKTASWIVRNYRSSSSVAVIDIHILRAGRKIGLFSQAQSPDRHYRELEADFLRFADAIRASATVLDSLVWDQMRRRPRTGLGASVQ